MTVNRKKSQILVLLILIIVCAIKTNFFKNLAEVLLIKFENRIENKYGFCSGESIGYLLYLKKKYQIRDNPKVINFIHTPRVNWAIINTKIINKNSKKFILLNYPGPKYKINLSMINNNIFEPKDIEFFRDKFDEIESFEILNNSINSKKINWKLEVFLVGKSGNEKIIRVINIKDILDESLKIKLNILNENLHLDKEKINFRLENKSISEIKNLQINLVMKNKYMLENFQIIDKIDNCYYIR